MKVDRPISSFRQSKQHIDHPHYPSEEIDDESPQEEHDAYNALQRICLDRHDGNTVIEVLLEKSGPTNIPELPVIPPIHQERSERKSFLNRLFKKGSSRPSPEEAMLPSTADSNSTDHHSEEELDYITPLPTTRSFKDLSSTVKMSNRHRARSEELDTFSSMSSLSGSKATTAPGPRGYPSKLERQESLGTNSIQDVRDTLQVMDQQLGKASDSGQRVSRQKVMRALFTVADSLEESDERALLRKQRDGVGKVHRKVKLENSYKGIHTDIDWDLENQENSELRAHFLKLHPPKSTKNNKGHTPFNLFSSMGKMFHGVNDEKKAVERALDDLLWTEFVVTRKKQEIIEAQRKVLQTSSAPNKVKPSISRKTVLEVKEPHWHHRKETTKNTKMDVLPATESSRSWWEPGVASNSSNSSSDSSSSSSSSSEEDDMDIGDEEFEDYDDDDTTDSEQELQYLPTNITVLQCSSPDPAKPHSQLGQSYPLTTSKHTGSFRAAVQPRNPRYRVHMV